MKQTFTCAFLAGCLALALATPAAAANKEHQQLMADLRMLQEQAQQLQNLIGSLNEAIKAVNARLDEQSNATRKSFADQKLTVDNLSNDLRVVREKVDDNNVRVGTLTQEVDALRQMIQQLSTRSTSSLSGSGDTAIPSAPADAGSAAPATAAPPPAPAMVGASPTQLFDMAFSNYGAGQYDLAVEGFEAYIRTFPRSDQADDAQVYIGKAYMQANKYDKAIEAFDVAIRNYPTGDRIPEAYFQKGVALRHVGQLDKAREALETVIKKYPTADAATMAQQQLQALLGRQ